MRMYVCRCLRMYIHMNARSACTDAGVGVRVCCSPAEQTEQVDTEP